MKSLFTLTFLLFGGFVFAQEVQTLTNITANGGISVKADGNIIVSHFGPLPFVVGQEGRNIYMVTPEGDVTTLAENVVVVGTGNTIDSQGDIYQGSFQENKIIKLDATGTVLNSSFVSVSGPVGVLAIENDTILVCSCGTNSVLKVAPDGSSTTFASGNAFNCANGITKDENGNIYTTNFSDGRITKITSDGMVSTLGDTQDTQVGNGHIAFRSADQMLYIASYSSNQIFRMDLDGNSVHFAGTGVSGANDSEDPLLATFAKPNGIEISPDGCSLYITQDENVLRKIAFTDNDCGTSGLINPDENGLFEVFPNPATNSFQIVNKSELDIQTVSLVNVSGQQVFEKNFEQEQTFVLNRALSGFFLVQITSTDGQRFVKKVLIQ